MVDRLTGTASIQKAAPLGLVKENPENVAVYAYLSNEVIGQFGSQRITQSRGSDHPVLLQITLQPFYYLN